MTAIALLGSSDAVAAVRRRLERSPLPFLLVDEPEGADIVVTDEEPPAANYLTVAAEQVPNRFYCRAESVRYVVAALTEAHLAGARGVRVRPPVQHNPPMSPRRWRRPVDQLARFDPTDYDWDTEESVEAEVFDGDVIVTGEGLSFTARLRARGRVDGNDGRYHWAGLLHGDDAPEMLRSGVKQVGVALSRVARQDCGEVPAKLTEITQFGSVRVTGIGTPPWLEGSAADLH